MHSEWYVQYHLSLVERITEELLDKYPAADRLIVGTLVWLHDIGKTIDLTDVSSHTRRLSEEILRSLGFCSQFCSRVDMFLELIDAKCDLNSAPIEVKIVSTADGCAHLVGPFMAIWWRDNPSCSIDELMAENRRKATVAWKRKIVLPEARRSFESRYRAILEQAGDIPAEFIVL